MPIIVSLPSNGFPERVSREVQKVSISNNKSPVHPALDTLSFLTLNTEKTGMYKIHLLCLFIFLLNLRLRDEISNYRKLKLGKIEIFFFYCVCVSMHTHR